MISITSMANEFNGMITEDALSIPFKGISQSQVNVEYANIESNWAIKLSIDSINISNQSIIRTFLLPQTASKPSVNWSSDKLNLRF